MAFARLPKAVEQGAGLGDRQEGAAELAGIARLDLAAELPGLLWQYQMGIILFWIHDDSPERRRTYSLVDHSAELVARLISLAGNPLMLPVRKMTLKLLRGIRASAA